MEFLVDNYIWFIVGGLAIIFIIIGYFADKKVLTGSKKDKVEDKKEKEIIIDETLTNEEMAEDTPIVMEENIEAIEPDLNQEQLIAEVIEPEIVSYNLEDSVVEEPDAEEPKIEAVPDINLPKIEELNQEESDNSDIWNF